MAEASFHQLCKLTQPQYIHVLGRTALFGRVNLAHIRCYPTPRIYDAFLIGIIQLPRHVSAHVAHGAVFMQIGHAYRRPFSCCSTVQQLLSWGTSGCKAVELLSLKPSKMIKLRPDCYAALGI